DTSQISRFYKWYEANATGLDPEALHRILIQMQEVIPAVVRL
ncbi:MAG: hypothetical protein A07HR60_00453, partial [uncultured archaeon A07HR60]